MRQRIMFVLLGAVLLLAAGVSPAGAAPPPGVRITKCGQTFTGTAYLDRDLTCTKGFEWIADPDSFDPGPTVSIDLRGHRLRGPGTGVAFLASGDPTKGVDLTVSNGRVDHWGHAFAVGFSGLTVNGVRMDHNDEAVSCEKGGCTVRDSVVYRNRSGGGALDGSLTFVNTRFVANETGLIGGSSYSDLYVYDSEFTANQVGIQAYPEGDTTVNNSVFTDNGVGFRGTEGIYATLTNSRFVRNGDGIYVDSAPAPDSTSVVNLKSNTAHHNKGYGIYAPGATDLGGNRAWKNGKPCVGVVCQGKS